jgi:hypothetical protein
VPRPPSPISRAEKLKIENNYNFAADTSGLAVVMTTEGSLTAALLHSSIQPTDFSSLYQFDVSEMDTSGDRNENSIQDLDNNKGRPLFGEFNSR